MDRRWLIGGLLVVVCGLPGVAEAQEGDPARMVATYAAALNAHDVPAALALFDEYGSATDKSGHNFAGRAALTAFLLGSGFGSPDARVTTQALHVVGNRAVWTYTCSCAAGSTEVRLVMNHEKISVFAVMPPVAPPIQSTQAGVLPWLFGLLLVAGTLAAVVGWLRGRNPSERARRASQGRLLAALVEARAATRSAQVKPP